MEPSKRYRAFGTFRFLLALAVALGHARSMAPEAVGHFISVWAVGTIGVLAFFVLSGFIISEALNTFYRDRPGPFIANRLLRLVPPYLAALIISLGLHLLFITTPADAYSSRNLAHQLLLLFISWGPEPPSYYFVRYIWAVSVELWFYFIYAVLFFSLIEKRNSGLGALLLFVASILAAYAAKRSEVSWIYPIWMAPYFLLGVALHWLAIKRNMFAAAATGLSSVATAWHVYDWYGRTSTGIGAAFVVLVLAAGVGLLALVQLGPSLRRIDSWLGDLSYPLYLNHFAVLALFKVILPSTGIILWLSAGAASCAVAVLAHYLVEPQIHALRTRLRGTEV